ncbi:dUTP diphosphatase [Virgibacillus necropolis]|uniref:dUTPase n=1 Tax=Virgibacillus necropolis TaxID=163877 RepID=A0A221MBM3_9BACI|nr:dUTP diphosphatase [Virgibacillus necropolis]ASN05041.1 dUTPase [Virgibacillus necropolis]
MDWDKLFSMQKQLDSHIEKKHDINEKFESKYLALLVELGELANETRCFKFWSTKAPSDRNTILEEYVDGLHFILSLGIEKGYRYESESDYSTNKSATNQFNMLYRQCVVFHEKTTHTNYINMFHSFLVLGDILGFDEKSIMDAYKKKNEKNYVRQEQGY